MEISLIKLPSRQEVFIAHFSPQFFHQRRKFQEKNKQQSELSRDLCFRRRFWARDGGAHGEPWTETQAKGDSGGERIWGDLKVLKTLGRKLFRWDVVGKQDLFSQTQRANVRWVCGCVVVRAWRKRAWEQMGRWMRDLLALNLPLPPHLRTFHIVSWGSDSILNPPEYHPRFADAMFTSRRNPPHRGAAHAAAVALIVLAYVHLDVCKMAATSPYLHGLDPGLSNHTRSREVGLGYFSCQDHTCTPASGVWAFFTHQPLIGHNCLLLLERKRSTRVHRSKWKRDSWCDDTWCQVACYYGYYGYYGYCTCTCSALVNAEYIAVV